MMNDVGIGSIKITMPGSDWQTAVTVRQIAEGAVLQQVKLCEERVVHVHALGGVSP